MTRTFCANLPAISRLARRGYAEALNSGSGATRSHVSDELDQAFEVYLLVVVECEVAALRADEESPVRECPRHPCQMVGIHRVVARADDQGRHRDVGEVVG